MEVKSVLTGPFKVADADADTIVKLIAGARDRRFVAFALHVGGLNEHMDERYVNAMNQADITYADGVAVVALARMNGAKEITRSATTDIGIPVIRAMSARLGRPVRLALLGGPPGLSVRAGTRIAELADAEVVLAEAGYGFDSHAFLEACGRHQPDLLLVGLGMPQEALWVHAHREDLPLGVVMTCGGWFGFLAGEERRAPAWVQRAGLEWLHRTVHAPGRLLTRYLKGMLTFCAIAVRRSRKKAAD